MALSIVRWLHGPSLLYIPVLFAIFEFITALVDDPHHLQLFPPILPDLTHYLIALMQISSEQVPFPLPDTTSSRLCLRHSYPDFAPFYHSTFHAPSLTIPRTPSLTKHTVSQITPLFLFSHVSHPQLFPPLMIKSSSLSASRSIGQ